MPITIDDDETEELARRLAARTGLTVGEALRAVLRERLADLEAAPEPRRLVDVLDEIALRCAALPTLDDRSEDEILGYDENGLPR
jgi:antitoxin VapB